MWLRFHELPDEQRKQARNKYIDAGTCRDDYWYETGYLPKSEIFRNRYPEEYLDEE